MITLPLLIGVALIAVNISVLNPELWFFFLSTLFLFLFNSPFPDNFFK